MQNGFWNLSAPSVDMTSLCPLVLLTLRAGSRCVHGLSSGVYFFLDPPYVTACLTLDYHILDSSLGFLMSPWLSISPLINPLFIYTDNRVSFESTNHNFPFLKLEQADRQTEIETSLYIFLSLFCGTGNLAWLLVHVRQAFYH